MKMFYDRMLLPKLQLVIFKGQKFLEHQFLSSVYMFITITYCVTLHFLVSLQV